MCRKNHCADMKSTYTCQAIRVLSILPPPGPNISGTSFACWDLLELVFLVAGWMLLQHPWDTPQQIWSGLPAGSCRTLESKLMGSFQCVEFVWLVGLVARGLGWHSPGYRIAREFSSSELVICFALHLLLLKGVQSLAQCTGVRW